MKHVLVTGGTGSLGKLVVDYLSAKNYTISILTSRKDISAQKGVAIYKGDLATNTGLIQATAVADIVIHCASNPKNFKQVDIEGTENLLRSINREKTRHFVYISIVGVDKSDYPYYQAKYAVEKMIADSGIPFTILRATQFHNFILNIIQSFISEESDGFVKIPMGMKFQSIDIREVTKRLVDGLEEASGLFPDFGGPEVLSFEDMAESYIKLVKPGIKIQAANLAGQRYDLFRSGINLCPDNAVGKNTWQSFLEEKFVLKK